MLLYPLPLLIAYKLIGWMIWYDMIWYDMIWYDMIWYDMIWYDNNKCLSLLVINCYNFTTRSTLIFK